MTSLAQPILTIIAGPNGAGKSTFTASMSMHGDVPVLDVDVIARRLRPGAPALAAVPAGRQMIRQQRAYLRSGSSFAIETTLAGKATLRLMEQARQQGYVVHLIYIGVNDVQATIDRIAERVARGGHTVPEQDARRRYGRSMRHLVPAIERSDRVTLIDNSLDQGPREMVAIDFGRITARAESLPLWVVTHVGLLL